MFLFPLGLSSKIKHLPYMCLLILIGTSLFSISKFSQQRQTHNALMRSDVVKNYYRSRLLVLQKDCQSGDSLHLSRQACQLLQNAIDTTVDTTKAAPPTALQNSILRIAKKKFKNKADIKKYSKELIVAVFTNDLWENNTDFPRSLELDEYLSARDSLKAKRKQMNSAEHILTKANLKLGALLQAQVTHDGWFHLIGNMIFFLIIGIGLEERVGQPGLLMIYTIGGIGGLLLELTTMSSDTSGLLGASANISALMGAFLVLFFKEHMRVWMSVMFVYNRIVLIPVWIFIPVFMIAQDIIGALQAQGDVAHMAHLGGALCGGLLGFAWKKTHPLPDGFLFPFETKLFEEAQSKQGKDRLLPLSILLYHHRDNRMAQDLALTTMIEADDRVWSSPQHATRIQKFLSEYFSDIFNQKLVSLQASEFIELINKLPSYWPLPLLVDEVRIDRIIETIQIAKATNREVAIRLLEVLIKQISQGNKKTNLQTELESQLTDLKKQAEDVSSSKVRSYNEPA